MDRVKLSYKSFGELDKLRIGIEGSPRNKNTSGGFHLYKPPARKRLEDIAWAITYKLMRND